MVGADSSPYVIQLADSQAMWLDRFEALLAGSFVQIRARLKYNKNVNNNTS